MTSAGRARPAPQIAPRPKAPALRGVPTTHETAPKANTNTETPATEASPELIPVPATDVRGPGAQPGTAPAKFRQGMVAYLRCDGAERVNARFPCPRDTPLETEVWRILSELGHCTVAAPGRGRAELRLAWSASEPMTPQWRSPDRGHGVDLVAVSKCTNTRLTALHSSPPPGRVVATFRFELD